MMRGSVSNAWRAAFLALLSLAVLERGVARAAAPAVRLMLRTDEPDERVYAGDKRLVFKQGLATADVAPGRVLLRRELRGVKWAFPYDVDPTKILRLPAWPRLAVDGLSDRERDAAVLHEQPGVAFPGGRELPVPEGPVRVDLKRAGKLVESVTLPAVPSGRTGRYMAWPLVARSCETEDGASRARALIDAASDEAFLHLDLSLLPAGTRARALYGRCELRNEGTRLKLPTAGWRGETIEVQLEGLGTVTVALGSPGEQRTLVDADVAAELCSSATTRRDGERMAAAAAAPEAGGLEVRYDGFAKDGALYLDAGECRLTGSDGLLRVPRRAFLERAVLRFQPRCGTSRPCLAVILKKSMPTDPAGYPLTVDGRDVAGLEGTVYLHRVPHGAELSIDGMPAVARPSSDGLSLDLARGVHAVSLNAPGRWPWAATVDVKYGDRIDLDARLDVRTGGWTEKLGKVGAAVGAIGVALVAGAFVVESSNQNLLDGDARQGPMEPARYRELVDGTRTANRLALSGGIAIGLGAAAVAGWSLLEPSGRTPAPEWPESSGASK
ncbi:MAG: hypothetical protein RL199_85 [Pseudomonadota bacterium]